MESMNAQDNANACTLFAALLVPPPTAEDVRAILAQSRPEISWSFVADFSAARDLCAQLEPLTFTALSELMQLRILTLMEAGLACGMSSVLRLRIGCESESEHPSIRWFGDESRSRRHTLVWRLLALLRKLAEKSNSDGDRQGLMRILGRVIGMVCSTGIKVNELKWILREIREPSAATKSLLTALSIMVSSGSSRDDENVFSRGPTITCPTVVRSVFNFDGAGSGLVLPEMQWPFAQEYQVALWLRVDEHAGLASNVTNEACSRRAHVFTLVTHFGAGVDYYLEGSRLFVTVADCKGSGQIQQKVMDLGEVGLIAGKWHAVVICHKRSSALLFNKDQLEVFVDERLVCSAAVPFPRNVTDTLARFSIGWDFDGQTSGVLLFSRGADLNSVWSMLRRLAGQTGPCAETPDRHRNPPSDPDLWIDSATVPTQGRFRSKLIGSNSIPFASLIPSRTVNGLCLDPHNGHHAQLRGYRTHAWTTHTASDVIRSIGGTPSLLPLAFYLLSDSEARRPPGSGLSPVDGENLDTVLSVLLSFLRGSVVNQDDFFRVGGMEILELLLRSAPRTCFACAGAHTVIVLEAIYIACDFRKTTFVNARGDAVLVDSADNLEAETRSLQHHVVVYLLANFPLWARAPPALQFGLATRLLDLVRDSPRHFRTILSVEAMLTSIRVCCADGGTLGDVESLAGRIEELAMPSGDHTGVAAAQCSEDAGSTPRGWITMARRERWHMRSCLWEVIRLLLGEKTTKEDGIALVRFVANCGDATLVSELMQVLGSLMRQSEPPRDFFRALEDASKGCPPIEIDRRGTHASAAPPVRTVFQHLVLRRCVLSYGSPEDLRVAGLRAASVFMARFERQTEPHMASTFGSVRMEQRRARDAESGVGHHGSANLGNTMSEKALMRDRHLLGESTYAALLEMALLADEREVAWSEQGDVISVANAENYPCRQRSGSRGASDDKNDYRRGSAANDKLAASIWLNGPGAQDPSDGRGEGLVLDDTQRIRNVLPLALILQHLPTMAGSIQVRSHGDLLLMLKLNEANRQKVVELSHTHGDRFWGLWERCLFLMMAPLFARRGDNIHKAVYEQGVTSDNSTREGDYFMVLKLYAILLEHTVCSDEEGHREIELAASLQPLIPHGKVAARVLLAQVAFQLGQNMSSSDTKQRQPVSQPASSTDTAGSLSDEQAHTTAQPRWNNIVHLAFVAANLVSDDVSTVTAGLFPESEEMGRSGENGDIGSEVEARRASAAAASIPVLLCSSPAAHGSLALSARVLGMFGVVLRGSRAGVHKLCSSRSQIPDQGPLMFPLLRLSLFLLVRLHPFTPSARENISRLESLVLCLVSSDWDELDKESRGSDDMCVVVLAHVHAALLRLEAQVAGLVDAPHKVISDATSDASEESAPGSPVGLATVCAADASGFSRTLLDLLQCVTRRRLDLLKGRLGERLTSALLDSIGRTSHDQANLPDDADERSVYHNSLACLKWMEGSPLVVATTHVTAGGRGGMPALLEACMPSLKAAEELESRAVRAAGERAQSWQELVSSAAAAIPSSDTHGPLTQSGIEEVVRALGQQAEKAEALVEIKTRRRLMAARQRLQRYMRALGAAWSPWARGYHRVEGCQPQGWEISSHKDQLMRQMLLVPVDKDFRHQDASYDESNTSSQQKPQRRTADEGLTPNSASSAVPGLKPSASLLAGRVGFVDDDEEETEAQDETESTASGCSTSCLDSGVVREGKEISAQPVVTQAEAEAAVDSGVSQHTWNDVDESLRAQGLNERTVQPTRGSWSATMLLRDCSVPGTLFLFAEALAFRSEVDQLDDSNEVFLTSLPVHHGQTWRWRLERLTQLHLRRFLLSPQAVELFWADSPEVFLAFQDVDKRQAFTRALRKQNLPMLPITTRHGTLHPRKVLKATRLTELWRRRQISNFQYIMELNVVAGRSYNDITQYPVFPWVLSDYTSGELDLDDPLCFRDLSKPVGALNEERRKAFEERYATFEDESTPKFMYGSHYSSAGVVLHYLVRQEPFTTLHIKLQDGRFDCPDRLFYDIDQCWRGCIDVNNMSDVKELTPEFFYCPEIFLNSNKLPLGEPQAGGTVNDVHLPPWANDAYEFVRLHRLALESEQVSQHLHEWIDLIFGYKQRGQEAIAAANVFYYLTYEGAVDLSQVNDPRQKEAMEAQIRHFGQTPSQLLSEPHPVRLPPEECVLPLFSSTSTLQSLRELDWAAVQDHLVISVPKLQRRDGRCPVPHPCVMEQVYSPRNWPPERDGSAALLVFCTEDRLVCVDAMLRVTTWAWSGLPNGKGLPFTLGTCRTTQLPSRYLHKSKAGAKRPPLLTKMAAVSTSSALEGSITPRMGTRLLTALKGSFTQSMSPGESVLVPGQNRVGYEEVTSIPPRSIGRVHSCFGLCTASGGNSDSLLCCGYWDHAVRRYSIDSSTKLILGDQGTGGHEGAINCLSIADGGSLLVTGGQDATCRVWVVGNASMALALGSADTPQAVNGVPGRENMVCVNVLYGHEAPITCLAVSEELDATVSGAHDGRIVLHCLKDGQYVRHFCCPPNAASGPPPEASQLVFSCHGDVVVHSWTDLSLHRFSINGTHLTTGVSPTALSCLLTAGGGEYLLGGGKDGLIRVYALHNLFMVHAIDLQQHGGLTCMRMSMNDEYLLAGSEDGHVSIITDAKTRLRMLDLALRKAFIG